MNDWMALFAAALIVAPIACSHDERGAQAPNGASSAGAPPTAPAPAPSTTNEPKGVEEGPGLNDAPKQTDPSGTAPISRGGLRKLPLLLAASGGTSPQGGNGGYGGVGLAGSGGSIITTASR